MARARSFRSRGISEAQRRKKSWIQVTGPTVSADGSNISLTQNPNLVLPLAAGAPVSDTFADSIGVFSDPDLDKIPAESTLLRLRGSVNLPKNNSGANEVTNIAIGIGVMESGAAALGAFPNPATPEGGAWDGWMFYRSQQQGNLDANSGVVDIKSMRKVQSGSSVIIVFGRYISSADGSVVSAPSATSAQINLRALILLP